MNKNQAYGKQSKLKLNVPFLAKVKDSVLIISVVAARFGIVRYMMPLKGDSVVYTVSRSEIDYPNSFMNMGLNRYSLIASTRV